MDEFFERLTGRQHEQIWVLHSRRLASPATRQEDLLQAGIANMLIEVEIAPLADAERDAKLMAFLSERPGGKAQKIPEVVLPLRWGSKESTPSQRLVEPEAGIPKWKLYLLLFPSAYVLSSLIVILLLAVLPRWPFIAVNFFVNVLLVFLLTYVMQPLSMRVFQRWLFPSSPQQAELSQRADDLTPQQEKENQYACTD